MVLLEAAMCGPSVEEGLHESPNHPKAKSSAMGIDLCIQVFERDPAVRKDGPFVNAIEKDPCWSATVGNREDG